MLPTVLLATALAVVLQVAEQLEMLWKGQPLKAGFAGFKMWHCSFQRLYKIRLARVHKTAHEQDGSENPGRYSRDLQLAEWFVFSDRSRSGRMMNGLKVALQA